MSNFRGALVLKLIGFTLLTAASGAYGQRDAAESPASGAMVSVLNPRGTPPPIPLTPLAPRLQTLNGKTLYLVDTRFMGGDVFLQQIQAWFAEHMPEVKTVLRQKKGSYGENDPELWAEIKEHGDAMIVAIGH